MGFLQRLAGAALAVVFLVATFVFAALAAALLVVAGLGIWGWLWWRARRQPRARRGAAVIEGEYRDVTPSPRIEKRERP
jgi:hypothetical protein